MTLASLTSFSLTHFNPFTIDTQTDTEQHVWANLPGSQCAEGKQSPINIETGDTKPGEPYISLTLIGYDDSLDGSAFTLENNGHTVQLTLDADSIDKNIIPRVKLGNGDTYQFKQLHFHWHQNDTKGSEHAINGRRSALEVSDFRLKITKETERETKWQLN